MHAAEDRDRASSFRDLTYVDELTGALHRRAGRDQLQREIARARRTGAPLAVAFVDLDRLKVVNDTAGHAAGDRVLHAVAQALIAGLRPYDTVIRYGGDEFVCGMPGANLDDARDRLTQVRTLLAASAPGCTVSVGLAAHRPRESADQVVARADADLYARRPGP